MGRGTGNGNGTIGTAPERLYMDDSITWKGLQSQVIEGPCESSLVSFNVK